MELPSRAVRENTDRQNSSLGYKIRQNIHPKTDRNDAKSCHNDATSCHVAEKRYKFGHKLYFASAIGQTPFHKRIKTDARRSVSKTAYTYGRME